MDASLYTTKGGLVLVKSALVKGSKIGAYNPFGDLIWIEKKSIVYTEKMPNP